MSQHRTSLFVFWLLPIMVLRALMPVGVMLNVSSGPPTIVMCSEGFSKAATPPTDISGTDQQKNQHGDQHSVCPFAAALAATPTVENSISVYSAFNLSTPAASIASQPSTHGPLRINLTRGPPSFS